MSFEGLQERLAALQETTSQLKDLIDRLANLRFQPGSVPLGTEEESSVSGELSAEIGQILRTGLEDQELLQEEAKYLRSEGHDKTRLKDAIERVGKELGGYRASFRKARLAAKKSLDQAQKLERELIIQSFTAPVSEATSPIAEDDEAQSQLSYRAPRHIHQQQHQSSLSENDQQTVGASTNLTSALRRTHETIAAELARSDFAHQTLVESSDALKQLDDSYGSLDTMLASSKDLLGTLLRSQKSDTWYLQTAFYMLLVTGAWLVFRRILYGPTWWLVWLPLRILFGIGSKAGSAVMPGKTVPGESGKGQIVGAGAKVAVEGLPKEDLPTAQVGQKKAKPTDVDPDSLLEKVGEIVDAAEEVERESTAWEETEGVTGEERVKDEL